MKEYPRVLMINCDIKKNNATGITLRSLWEDWPSERMMNLMALEYKAGDVDFPCRQLDLPRYAMPLRAMVIGGAELLFGSGSAPASGGAPGGSGGRPLGLKTLIHQWAVRVMDSRLFFIPRALLEQIEAFQPDVIYTLGSTLVSLKLADQLAGRLKIPVILHFMDNWVEHIQWEDNPMLRGYAKKLRRMAYQTMKRSRRSIAVSQSMARAYEKKFGVEFSVLMNAAPEAFFHMEHMPAPRDRGLRFVYAGGLHLNRAEALREIAEAIRRESVCGDDRLIIYTSRDNRKRHEAGFAGLPVSFHDPVAHGDMQGVFRNADVLVHAETNNPLMTGFFRYSISTKIPEYLASGKPVLFYGPDEMGLYSYLDAHKAALVAADPERLREQVARCIRREDISDYCRRGRALARENHTQQKAKDELYAAVRMSREGA